MSVNWQDYGKALLGLSFYGPDPDPGGIDYGSTAHKYPEISGSGHTIVMKATVALSIGDLCIVDPSNSKQVTKSTGGGSFLGVCVGAYGMTTTGLVAGLHTPCFVAGPAAGAYAIIQTSGVATVYANTAFTVGNLITMSSTTAGAAIPYVSGSTPNQPVGIALVTQATTGQPAAILLITGAYAVPSGDFPSTLVLNGTTAYTPPTGATYLRVTLYGPSGGGGGGITTPHTGGNGAVGGLIRGIALVGSNGPFVVAVGTGGTAGTSGASPTNGGNGSAATTMEDANSVNTLSAGAGGGGVAASSGGNGANGSAPSNTATADEVVFPTIDLNSTTLGAIGGAGGVGAGASKAGLNGFILIEPF